MLHIGLELMAWSSKGSHSSSDIVLVSVELSHCTRTLVGDITLRYILLIDISVYDCDLEVPGLT